MNDLSVVIVSTKPRDDILCIPYLESSNFGDYEIIIRDDEGISNARNRGIEKADADKIIFIDDDAIPCEGYLKSASDALDQDMIIAGQVCDPSDTAVSDLATTYPTGEPGRYITHVVGCNMAFRREVFETVGYFDESFDWGHEETELISRAIREFPIYYEPSMKVNHTYVDSIYEYFHKQQQFGRANVYWQRKQGKSDREILFSCFDISKYYTSSLRALPISVVGKTLNSISMTHHLFRTR